MRPRMYGSTPHEPCARAACPPRARPARRSASSKSSGYGLALRGAARVGPPGSSRDRTIGSGRMELEGRHVVVTGAGERHRPRARAALRRRGRARRRRLRPRRGGRAAGRGGGRRARGRRRRRPRGGHPRADLARRGGQRPDRPVLLQRRHHRAERRPRGARRRLGPAVARQHDVARVGGARAAARHARARRGLPVSAPRRPPGCSPSSARSATRSPSTRRSRSPSGCR